jgi:signal transduction histidine kinase
MLFKDIPIQKKLMRIIFLISMVVSMITCIIFFVYEIYVLHQATTEKLSTIGKIIASNSTAALAFDDHEGAKEILAALKAEPNVEAACIYDNNGKIFSQYPSNLGANAFPVKPESEGYRFVHFYLEGYQPIVENTKQLGTLYLKSGLGAIYEGFGLYGIIIVLAIAIPFLLAYLLSGILQKNISQPILSLAETAKIVSDKGDYSLRAVKISKDELGSLTDAFNQMLTQIEEQNLALSEFNQNLEQEVESRTKMLRETLTALENTKEELSATLEKEKELNELKSRFVTMASHEFRTPLSTILSSTFLLEKYNTTHEIAKREKHLEYIKSAVSDMKNTLEDFLSLGKLEEDLIQPKQEIINADELFIEIQKIAEEMEHHCKPGQQFVFQSRNTCPAYIDRHIFRNILLNLLSNAIKYSPENSIIKINCIANKDRLIVEVEDSGIGISEEDIEHLFERFFRAKNAANIQGTGLGLHIVSRYLKLMNGHIEIKSELNRGTTFTFYIPFKTNLIHQNENDFSN